MKLYCKAWKKTVVRKKADVVREMTKRGYKSYCEEKGRKTYLHPVDSLHP